MGGTDSTKDTQCTESVVPLPLVGQVRYGCCHFMFASVLKGFHTHTHTHTHEVSDVWVRLLHGYLIRALGSRLQE